MKAIKIWSVAVLVLCSSTAYAQSASDVFSVTANVVDACAVTANDLAFGTYATFGGGDLDSTTTINVMCTNGTSYDVALDSGATVGGSIATRLMTDTINTLQYNLYTDASRTSLWGDGTGASVTVSGTGTGTQQSITVYGRVPGSQLVPTGSYSDTVTATVNF